MLVFEKLSPDHLEQFKSFCAKHRSSLDDSFISEMEMASFCPSPSFPTVLAMEDGSAIASASLILDDYHLRGNRARFRILYSERADPAMYWQLLIRNAAFASLKGSQTPKTADDVAAMENDVETIPGGIFLLRKDGRDLGLVRAARDPGEDGSDPRIEIGPLAVMPGHQGKGYGKLLLRHALRFGTEEIGLPQAVLSVNAENMPALGLYLREGFAVSEGYSCMRQDF